MPYDFTKSKQTLKIVGAYDQHPLGGLLKELADLLRDAEKEIMDSVRRANDAESRMGKIEADLESCQQTIRRLRSGSTGMNDLVDALKSISLNPKGASKVAKTALEKTNKGEESPI